MAEAAPEFVLRTGGGGATALAFVAAAAGSPHLAVGSSSGELSLWSLQSRRRVAAAAAPACGGGAAAAEAVLAVLPAPGALITHSRAGRLLLWDAATLAQVRQVVAAPPPALPLVCGLDTGAVSFAPAALLQPSAAPPPPARPCPAPLEHCPCVVAAAPNGHDLSAYDLRCGGLARTYRAASARGMAMAVQTTGGLLAAGYEDGSLSFFDAASGAEVEAMRARPLAHPLLALSFSADGSAGVAAGAGAEAVAFRMDGGLVAEVDRFPACAGARPGVAAAALRPGGREGLLAAACWDRRLRLWHVPRLRKPRARPACPLAVLRLHTDTVAAVAWAPAAPHLLASASADGRVALWSLYND